jgi:hypothetical protein
VVNGPIPLLALLASLLSIANVCGGYAYLRDIEDAVARSGGESSCSGMPPPNLSLACQSVRSNAYTLVYVNVVLTLFGTHSLPWPPRLAAGSLSLPRH